MDSNGNPKTRAGIAESNSMRKGGPGIVWDEDNLAENERIKATLNPIKINEPKTPFHELLPDDDVDLQPLSLDGDAAGPSGAWVDVSVALAWALPYTACMCACACMSATSQLRSCLFLNHCTSSVCS